VERQIFLLKYFPYGKLFAAEHWLAPRFRSTLCPSTANQLHKSAGDSLRLTRRGQEKNVEERVPVFTQHTQFFHMLKIHQCKFSPARKYNDSWKKKRNFDERGETYPKRTAAIPENVLWKS